MPTKTYMWSNGHRKSTNHWGNANLSYLKRNNERNLPLTLDPSVNPYGKQMQTWFGVKMCVTWTMTQLPAAGKVMTWRSSRQNTARRSVVTLMPATTKEGITNNDIRPNKQQTLLSNREQGSDTRVHTPKNPVGFWVHPPKKPTPKKPTLLL